jgi:hypothetical protein
MYLGSYGNTAPILALGVWGRPLSFSTPQKGDLDRKLSELMHDSRHKLRAAEQRTDRPWQHGRIVVENFARADEIQKEAMERAKVLVATFIQRTGRPVSEVVEWARPHLENLNRSLIGGVPPETRGEYERLRLQHEATFSQRLDSLLRDIEIGYEAHEGFAPPTPDHAFITFAEATGAPSNPPVVSTDTQSEAAESFVQLGPRPVPRVIEATIEERMVFGETLAVERRLAERPQDIREAARALSRAISEQIDELNALKPNDPDALTRQETFVAFMQRIVVGLDELAASLERISVEPPASRGPLYAKSAAIVRSLGKSVTKGLEENRASIMACSLRVPVVLAGTGLLHLLGVSPDIAAGIVAGLMGIDVFRSDGKK